MPEAQDHVLLICDDDELRDAVRAQKPPAARLSFLRSESVNGDLPRASQLWIDLDAVRVPPPQTFGRRVYFYSHVPRSPERLPSGLFVRKPCAATVVSILWADIETRPEILSGPPVDQRLPDWVTPLHRLELDKFCRACVEHLPRQFGYAELALYLFEPEDRILALAGTNCRHAVDLAIRVDAGNSHVFAQVARSSACCVAGDLPSLCRERGWTPAARSPSREQDAVLIAPLMHESALQGLAHFSSPLSGSRAVDDVTRDQVRAFLARCILHAQRYRRARNEARVDPLTGLHNLRAMREALELETRRAERYQSDLCVIALDLDGLKSVNDRFGHAAGDAVLKHTAAKIRSALRQIDTAARIGGDEFLVMLPGTDLDGARSVGQRILRMLRDDGPLIGETRLSLTASLGVAEWNEQCDIQRLLDAADGALYAAKSGGRDRITLADHVAPSDPAPASV